MEKNLEMNQVDLHIRKLTIRKADAKLAGLLPPEPLTDDLLAQAVEITEGKVRFNGLQPPEIPRTLITVGRPPIDWSGAQLNHQEWPTQLNRFFLLHPLMLAFKATGEARFAEAARSYIDDWIAHFDAANIALRGNTCMDIGIRLGIHGGGGWGGALATFMDEPSWDDPFIERMMESMERQAHILWKQGIPSRGGNHLIFGLDGLLHAALRLPFMADAAAMQTSAVGGLRQALKTQFLPDGAHIERTLQYHQHMTGTFVYMAQLGRAFPEAALDVPVDRLLAAIDYLAHNLSGGINDDSAEIADLAHAADWALARQWREQLTGRPEPDWRPARDAVFPDAGQVFARSSWEPGADYLAFDAAPYGGGHAHLARLGLVFRSGGRLWLADPGMFDYEMSNPFAVYGRSTAAHGTLNVNGLNQGVEDARLLRSAIDDDVVFLRGLYPGGYWSGTYKWSFNGGFGAGVYGRHERMALWIRGEYLLIFDAMTTDAGHTVENVWQLAPVKGWEHDPAALAWQTRGEANGFYLRMVMPPPDAEMTVYEGQRAPLRGWFCETYSTGFVPAPQVVFRYPAGRPAFFAVLAMPLSGGAAPPVVHQSSGGWGRGLELRWADGRVDCVGLSASLAMPLAADSPFETDSPLVWLRTDPDGAPVRQFMLDGTFLRLRGGIQKRTKCRHETNSL
jgi:hypothetical protein